MRGRTPFPQEFKLHVYRLSGDTLNSWLDFKEKYPYLSQNEGNHAFMDITNALLDAVETGRIVDPEFVWLAAKAGIYTGQLNRTLDITWKFSDSLPAIRAQAAFAQAFRGQTAESLALLKAAEYMAEKQEDLPSLVELLGIRTFVLTVQKNFQEAIGVFIKASQLASGEKEYDQWLQMARVRHAYALLKLGYISDASVANNRVLALANQAGDRWYKGWALNGLGHCLDRVGKTDDALKLYNRSLKVSMDIHATNLTAITLNRIGMSIAWRKKQLEESADYFRRSIAAASEGDAEWLIFGPMANLAVVKKMMGQYFEALELFEGVKDRSEGTDVQDQIFAYLNLSDILAELGDKERSQEYRAIADELSKKAKHDELSERDRQE